MRPDVMEAPPQAESPARDPFHLVLATNAVEGGAWMRLAELARGLAARGHALDLISYRSRHTDALAAELPGMGFHPIELEQSRRGTGRLAVEVTKRLRRLTFTPGRPVWLGSYAANSGLAFALNKAWVGRQTSGAPVRMFSFLRGAERDKMEIRLDRHDSSALRTRVRLAAFDWAARRLLGNSDLLIMQSDVGVRVVTDAFADVLPERVSVLPNNVNARWIEAHLAEVARDGGLPRAAGFHVGFVGRFNGTVKGIDTVLAMADRTRDLDIVYDLVGDGPDRAAIAARVHEMGLDGHVVLHGWQDNPLVVLDRADVVVAPSRSEPFPNVLMEALALGKPCLGSDVDGVPAMLHFDELLLPPGDAEAWAARVREVATDADALALIQRLSTERADAFRFDWVGRLEALLFDGLPATPARS